MKEEVEKMQEYMVANLSSAAKSSRKIIQLTLVIPGALSPQDLASPTRRTTCASKLRAAKPLNQKRRIVKGKLLFS